MYSSDYFSKLIVDACFIGYIFFHILYTINQKSCRIHFFRCYSLEYNGLSQFSSCLAKQLK